MILSQLLDQIRFARRYTCRLLDSIPPSDWVRIPPAGVSHIAWQVGHLAMAGYRLALERIRGQLPEDAHLLSDAFLAQFGRDSQPDPDPSLYPSPDQIRAVYEAVHDRIALELPDLPEEQLQLPPHKPHVLCSTRGECLMWCSHHEMIHAGQIGLLRRQLGHNPLW